MENTHLIKAKKLLPQYFSYFKNDNILIISEVKEEPPFCYVIHDDNYPNNLLISLAVDYPYCDKAVEVSLILNNIKAVLLYEQFYISKSGVLYWGDDASKNYELDTLINLENFDPDNKNLH